MRSLFASTAITLLTALSLPAAMRADCPVPATVGIVICQPSANAVITNVPHIEANTNPTSGTIVDLKVWIDGRLVDERNGPQENLFEGGVNNGGHSLQIQAEDGQGRVYKASEFFTMVGLPPETCPLSGAGVRICWPIANQFTAQDFVMSLGFRGQSQITSITAYLDGRQFFNDAPPQGTDHILAGGTGTTAGTHNLTVVTRDSTGHVYKASNVFNTYYDGSCPPKGTQGCNPGIFMNTPQDGDDVHSPFRLSGNVEFNTAPITAMKAYLDGHQIAGSFGPTLDQPVNAAKGTHILVVQAWDTRSRLYKVVQNVNVQ